MKLSDAINYIEDEDPSYHELATNFPAETVELQHKYAKDKGTYIEINSDDADKLREKKDLEDIRELLEDSTSILAEKRNDIGWSQGEESASNGYSADQLARKVDTKDKKAKAAQAGIAGSTTAFAASYLLGSVPGMGLSVAAGAVSTGLSSQYQGQREGAAEVAAEELSNIHGNKPVRII